MSLQARANHLPILLLGLVSGVSPFAMTVVVPALPSLTRSLDTTPALAQFVLSAYLIGLAVGQPFHGQLCDRFGRRPILLAGFTLFLVASIVATFAPTLPWLIVARVIQAIGASVGTVAARAMVRDVYDTERAAQMIAYIAAAMGIAPMLGPMIGGVMAAKFGWQSLFLVSAFMGAGLLLWMQAALPETLVPDKRRAGGLKPLLQGYRLLLQSRDFVGYTLVYGFFGGIFFSFVAVGALVFERDFGWSEAVFGMVWGSMALLHVLGAITSGRIISRIGMYGLLRFGVLSSGVMGLIQIILVSTLGTSVLTLLLPFAALMTLSGLVLPVALTGAVGNRPEIAGLGSGLSSSLGLLIGGMFTIVSGALYDGTAVPTVVLIAICTTSSVLGFLLISPTRTAATTR